MGIYVVSFIPMSTKEENWQLHCVGRLHMWGYMHMPSSRKVISLSYLCNLPPFSLVRKSADGNNNERAENPKFSSYVDTLHATKGT